MTDTPSPSPANTDLRDRIDTAIDDSHPARPAQVGDNRKDHLMTYTIQPGQIYRSLSNRHHPVDGPTRIKVVGEPGTIPGGGHKFGKVDVVTLTKAGREIRRRAIEISQLHDSDTTRDGQPRRTGYVLEER